MTPAFQIQRHFQFYETGMATAELAAYREKSRLAAGRFYSVTAMREGFPAHAKPLLTSRT